MSRTLAGMRRCDLVADAAISLIARSGVRALTHRAVDAEAGVPLGTTSNYFRTREALLNGVAERLKMHDRRVVLAGGGVPTEVVAWADMLGQYVVAMATEYGYLARARIALTTEVPEQMAGPHARLKAGIARALGPFGVDDAEGDAQHVIDYIDGVIIHCVYLAAALPDADVIAQNVLRLVGVTTLPAGSASGERQAHL